MPEAPTPPEGNPQGRALFRVLLALVALPVLLAVGARPPNPWQDALMTAVVALGVLIPVGAFAMSAATYGREDYEGGVGYAIGGCVAIVVGSGSCAAATIGYL